jgi:hypothetical protein
VIPKEYEMKANIKSQVAMLALLACSTLAFAQPLLLDDTEMDRVTAGVQPIFERIASILAIVPQSAGSLNFNNRIPLTSEQSMFINQLITDEVVAFRPLFQGESTALYQLKAGDRLTLIDQVPAGAQLMTYQLKPGESLHIQQTSAGGPNYIYVHSSGTSVVSTSQTNFTR